MRGASFSSDVGPLVGGAVGGASLISVVGNGGDSTGCDSSSGNPLACTITASLVPTERSQFKRSH